MATTVSDALQILGLKPDYTPEELENARKAFKSKYHPDKAGDDELKRELMAQKYATGLEAYELLKSNKSSNNVPFSSRTPFGGESQKTYVEDITSSFNEKSQNFNG